MTSKPTPMEKVLMQTVLMLCVKISTTTKADCFFEYAPHVGFYCVHVYRNGWAEGLTPEWVDMGADITEVNLLRTINELRKLHEEVKEKENV